MYLKAAVCTVLAWFIGLVADANINFGDPQGFLCLRLLLPGYGALHPQRTEKEVRRHSAF